MKRVTRIVVAGFGAAVVLFLMFAVTSSKTEAKPKVCGPVLHVPLGSKVVRGPSGKGLRVTFPNKLAMGINCSCASGGGTCTEAFNGQVIFCMTQGTCTDCKADMTQQ